MEARKFIAPTDCVEVELIEAGAEEILRLVDSGGIAPSPAESS
jgi:hypothetical protein